MVIGSHKCDLPKQAFDRYDYVNWKYYTELDDIRALSPASDGKGALSPVAGHPEAAQSDQEEPRHRPQPHTPPLGDSIDLTQLESDNEDEDVELNGA